MKKISNIYKIAYGPSDLLNSVPYLSTKKIIEIAQQSKLKINYLEINLYYDYCVFSKQAGIIQNIKKAFEFSKFKFKILTNKQPTQAIQDPLTIDFLFIGNKNKVINRYRVVATGGGFFTISGVEQHKNKYNFKNWEQLTTSFKKSKKNYFDFVSNFENKNDLSNSFTKCYEIMENICKKSLNKSGKLNLINDKKINYIRRAKSILKNKSTKETQEEKIVRELSAYAYAIGEEISNSCLMAITPTGCSAACFWAAVIYAKQNYHLSQKQMNNGLAAAGLVCSMIEQNASLSSYHIGCQTNIATACAMAAVFFAVTIYNANIDEVSRVAEMALEHMFGLVCNSICSIPLVPCIQRNAIAVVNAYELTILNHSLMPTNQLVKLDTSIQVLFATGKDLLNKNKHMCKGGYALNAKYVFNGKKK